VCRLAGQRRESSRYGNPRASVLVVDLGSGSQPHGRGAELA